VSRIIFMLLLALVLLAPLPLGSNREWSWTLCALLTALLALTWSLRAARRPREPLLPLGTMVWTLFLAVCVWVMLQAVESTPTGWHHPVWRLAGAAFEPEPGGSISVAGEDTLVALQRLLAYGLLFFLAFQLCRRQERASALFRWLALGGLVYAIYGLTVYWGEFGTLLWFRDEAFKADVRGTFVNRNSFATYLGLCVLCALANLYRKLSPTRNPAYAIPGQRQWRIEQFIMQAAIPLAALLLMLSALILTHSRAGFASFISGAVTLALAVRYRSRFRSARSLGAVAAALAVTVTAFVLTSGALLERIDRMNMDWPGRLEAYSLTSGAIGDNPVLGFGYGTYSSSFRLYRDDALDAHFDTAHDTYLENIFELGWPAAGALFLCVAWLAGACLGGLRHRGRDWIYPAAGLSATVLVTVHSIFDFSLQIPAVAMTYACIMGAACAQSRPSAVRRVTDPTAVRVPPAAPGFGAWRTSGH
jgi:O-antigen ligase